MSDRTAKNVALLAACFGVPGFVLLAGHAIEMGWDAVAFASACCAAWFFFLPTMVEWKE